MMQRSRGVRFELDGVVGLGELEEAAVAFARRRRRSWWPMRSSR